MRDWDRLFFVNERRLRNFVKAGRDRRRQPGDPAGRHAQGGRLVNGTWSRAAVLESLGLDPSRPTVLYAPTWSPPRR